MKHTLSRLGCVSAVLFLGATSGWAQAAATPAAPVKKGWETVAAAGLTVQSGNSESVATTISLDTKRKWEEAEAMLGGNGGYGKGSTTGQDRSRTTDYTKAYGQYNHFMTERLYWGLRLDGERDGIADLAYRVRIAPLIGYYVIKNDKTILSFDAGPSYVIEEREASPTVPRDKQGYLALRFGEKFEHKLSETSKLWQSVEYITGIEDWPARDLINFEVGLSTNISGNWGLQVKYQVNYDNGVTYGKECTDTRLIAATTYSF